MKISKITALVLAGSVALIVGCGSSSDNSSTTEKTGTFIDAPVANLAYETSSGITGVTDEEGHFRYVEGDKITFKLGKLKSDPIPAKEIITPLELSEGNETIATNIAYILQNLDTDGNISNDIIELPPQNVLETLLSDVNISNENNVTQTIAKIKPLIEKELNVKLPDVNITEAYVNMSDNVIKAIVINNTFYVPTTDVPNRHIETVTFNSDGTVTVKWTEDGQEYTSTYNFTIENGKLIITGEDSNGNKINLVYSVEDLKRVLFTNYEAAKFALLIENRTFASLEEGFIVFKNDGTWQSFSQNNQDSGKWMIDEKDGNLVLYSTEDNLTHVVSLVKDYNASVVEVKMENGKDIYLAVLNTIDPLNITITSSDDLKPLNNLIGVHPFSNDLISGKTVKSFNFNESYIFNDDGTFKVEENNNITDKGTWSIDSNGVLVMQFDSDNHIAYVVLGEIDNNILKVIVFGVDSNNNLKFATPDAATVE